MADRIQLTQPYTYMNLDGQWQVVLGGSIIDVASATKYPSATVVGKVATVIPTGSHAVSVNSKTR